MTHRLDPLVSMQMRSVVFPWPPKLMIIFLVASATMLAATLLLHVPLMLWDHIDLVPMYEAWRQGDLKISEFWRIHDGSHFHSAAYAVLLLTTWLSGGRPWLDCVVSWVVFAAMAWALIALARMGWRDQHPGRFWWGALLLLVFHPGHLANLQWGWQVAVFISLFGAVMPIYLASRARVTHPGNFTGVLMASMGVLGFTTTLAVFPVVVALLVARTDEPVARRASLVMPWVVAAAVLACWLTMARNAAFAAPGLDVLLLYVLNYLGSGVLRLASSLAPWWAAMALAVALPTAWKTRRDVRARPWLALMAFAVGCALLTAIGRAGPFGAEHAFVIRYVSFAILFWIGWLGLMVLAWQGSGKTWSHAIRPLLVLTAVFALANGIHMTKKAVVVRERAVSFAALIRQQYPNVDAAVMSQAYEGRAAVAQPRLGQLRERRFAPFVQEEGTD